MHSTCCLFEGLRPQESRIFCPPSGELFNPCKASSARLLMYQKTQKRIVRLSGIQTQKIYERTSRSCDKKKNRDHKPVSLPLCKLNKPTSLACWYLNMYKLTILAENLSQMVIGNVSIQVSNKNLQKSLKSQIVAQKEISEK